MRRSKIIKALLIIDDLYESHRRAILFQTLYDLVNIDLLVIPIDYFLKNLDLKNNFDIFFLSSLKKDLLLEILKNKKYFFIKENGFINEANQIGLKIKRMRNFDSETILKFFVLKKPGYLKWKYLTPLFCNNKFINFSNNFFIYEIIKLAFYFPYMFDDYELLSFFSKEWSNIFLSPKAYSELPSLPPKVVRMISLHENETKLKNSMFIYTSNEYNLLKKCHWLTNCSFLFCSDAPSIIPQIKYICKEINEVIFSIPEFDIVGAGLFSLLYIFYSKLKLINGCKHIYDNDPLKFKWNIFGKKILPFNKISIDNVSKNLFLLVQYPNKLIPSLKKWLKNRDDIIIWFIQKDNNDVYLKKKLLRTL